MNTVRAWVLAAALTSTLVAPSPSRAQDDGQPLQTGAAAMSDWRADAPGVRRKITPADLPAPFATRSATAGPGVAPRPEGAAPKVPDGFKVAAFASDLNRPRQIRIAPNGDIFVAETGAGKIVVLRAPDGAAKPEVKAEFAAGLTGPFGMAFYPAGPHPKWVYVAQVNSVVRFPYREGDLKPRGPAETVVAQLAPQAAGGHTTRDLVFSRDGKRMFISVGSASNVAEEISRKTPDEAKAWQAGHPLGEAWDKEENRADVLAFTPEGKSESIFASGIRNCVSMAVNPITADLWCVTNERDQLGDNLVPDYATRVREGGFYGWPWYYIGDHEDPRRQGERPDLAGKVTIPDVLFQSHSAPLGLVFYPERATGPSAFPAGFAGDAFVALHGSWNRESRTGYKVVRMRLNHGVPTGEYDDFLVGFVVDAAKVWGRPVGVAVAHDGSLLVTDDASGTIWRVSR
jgi:glucose/arabinose dehydrogenase